MTSEPINAASSIEEACKRMLSKATPIESKKHRFGISIEPRMAAVGIPERYRMEISDWNCPKQERVFKFCQNRFKKVGAIIALVGERGVGKTMIASQLCRDRIDQLISHHEAPSPDPIQGMAYYLKLTDLIALFKPLYADFGSIDIKKLFGDRETLCQHSLLCLDELHECEDQHLKRRVLTDILDRRYSNRADTLLISNETQEAFRASVGDSALSRISEHGEIISCVWKSFRDRKP